MMDDEGRPFETSPASGDLDACAREPIHVPGHIQPHGLLLVIEPDSRAVLQASDNLAGFGLSADGAIPGAGLKEIVGGDAATEIEMALNAFTAGEGPTLLGPVTIHDRVFDLVVHRVGDRLILELEAETADSPRGSLDGLYPHIQAFVGSLPALSDEESLGSAAAAKIRELTGFDRVLVYRFDEDWNGTVVAEARGERLP
ncbi:MAG: ATPase, partial [Fulvimarina manganoxydans]|nr:ATPase [Fulvimarina manganoxydans]